jgi:ribosomal protein S6
MPTYELLCIARPKLSMMELKGLMKRTALVVMDNEGVVRDFQSLGLLRTPYPMKKNVEIFNDGR